MSASALVNNRFLPRAQPSTGNGGDSYAQTVTVAKSGGDFTSAKAAVESITDASAAKPYAVVVYPGVYTENPFTLPPYVTLSAQGRGSVVLVAAVAGSPFITLSPATLLLGLAIIGPAASSAVYVAGGVSGCGVENCTFVSGLVAIEVTGAGSNVVIEECKAQSGVTTTILASASGRADCSNVLSLSSGTIFDANVGVIWAHNSGGIGSTTGCYAQNGGIIYPHCVTFEGLTYGLRTGAGVNLIDGTAVAARSTITNDVYQQAAGSIIKVVAASFDLDSFSVADWSEVLITMGGEEQGVALFEITEDLAVGVAEQGRIVNAGEGVPYTRGMVVITTDSTASAVSDGGNLTDVSAAARSRAGSTFTFQGTAVNHTILIGSEIQGADVLKHWGLLVLQTAAAVGGAFVLEVWDGAAWSSIGIMSVSQPEAYRYANQVFIRANSTEVLRYGADDSTSWVKKTISGKNLFWARIRISSVVATAPVFQQFRLLPSSFVTESQGVVTLWGRSRFRDTIGGGGNVFGETGGVGTVAIAIGSGGVPTGWNQQLKNCDMNGNGDAVTYQIPIPPGTDTSMPLFIETQLQPRSGGAGTVTMIGSLLALECEGVEVADPTGGVMPVPRSLANTDTVTANPGIADTQTFPSGTTDKIQTLTFGPFDISDYYEGDMLALRVELDDDGTGNANVAVWNASILGSKWTLGRRVD